MDWLFRFDPDPLWYIWSLHIITIASFPIYLVSMFCILRIDIASKPSYKYLLAVNATMNYLTQLSISAGAIPIQTLPCPGGYPTGILTQLGFSSCFQFSVIVCLVIGSGLSTTVLFFYRSHMAMKFTLRQLKFITRNFAIGGLLVPCIMSGFLCDGMDLKKDIAYLQNTCPDIYVLLPDYIKTETLIIIPNGVSIYVVNFYFAIIMVIAVHLIIYFNYRATVTLRRQIFSQTTIIMHKKLVRCLLIQTTVYYGLFSLPLVCLFWIVLLKLSLPSIGNLAFIVLSLSDPASAVALVLGHKKYRQAVFRLFRKEENVSRNSSRIPRTPVVVE